MKAKDGSQRYRRKNKACGDYPLFDGLGKKQRRKLLEKLRK